VRRAGVLKDRSLSSRLASQSRTPTRSLWRETEPLKIRGIILLADGVGGVRTLSFGFTFRLGPELFQYVRGHVYADL